MSVQLSIFQPGDENSLCTWRGGITLHAGVGRLAEPHRDSSVFCWPFRPAAQGEASAAQHPGKGFNNVLKIKPKCQALVSSCAASKPHGLSVINMEFSLPLALSGNPGALQASSCMHSFTLWPRNSAALQDKSGNHCWHLSCTYLSVSIPPASPVSSPLKWLFHLISLVLSPKDLPSSPAWCGKPPKSTVWFHLEAWFL